MIEVVQFRCNEFVENCYVAYDVDTKEAIIIDPGMKYQQEWKQVKDFISNNALKPCHILLTHYHIDHILGTGLCAQEYNLQISGSLEDQLGLPTPEMQGSLFGLETDNKIERISIDLKEGDYITIGKSIIKVIDCPGHSFHGLCYYLPEEKILFTGDVLFYCSVGRSDFGEDMGCNGQRLVYDIATKLLVLPKDVTIYPGHGPKTSVGQEATYNPFI